MYFPILPPFNDENYRSGGNIRKLIGVVDKTFVQRSGIFVNLDKRNTKVMVILGYNWPSFGNSGNWEKRKQIQSINNFA